PSFFAHSTISHLSTKLQTPHSEYAFMALRHSRAVRAPKGPLAQGEQRITTCMDSQQGRRPYGASILSGPGKPSTPSWNSTQTPREEAQGRSCG
ncbi:hypothetical protein KXX40_003221, partial [Aspergillus fumigatus]